MAKVLIVKLGYSETLDSEISTTTSLGDVVRTTVILNFLKNDDVSWLVDKNAKPLLDDNPYISRVLVYSLETVLQLQRERFDTVINLEKVPGICALADSINAWKRYGFRFEEYKGVAQSYDGAEKVLSLSLNLDEKKKSKKYWQEALVEMIGKQWKGEEYIFNYKPESKVVYDIGLNWATGSKWQNKGWPKESWNKLEDLLKKKYSVTWQTGFDNLYEYMDWINANRVIVTNDSLGMHLAIALKKKVVVLFGPTSSAEVYLYDRGEIVLPKVNYTCVPCLQRRCFQKKLCMYFIKPEEVKKAVDRVLAKKNG
jgi:heptosyltransferase-2